MCPPQSGNRTTHDTPWPRAVDLASVQGGAIGHAQLRACGLSRSAIQRRRDRGDLRDRHPRVYATAPLTRFGGHCAAALAVGARGALAHWSAAAAVGACDWLQRPQVVVLGGGIALRGVEVHRTRALPDHDITTNATGIRATWWPRTTIDLAEQSSIAELQTLLDRLERLGLLDVGVLQRAIAEAAGKRGQTKLHTALEPFTTIPEAEYLSLLERFAAMLLRKAGFVAEVNGRVRLRDGQQIRIDLLLREQRIAIEVDGRDSHARTLQFGVDRWRDRELQKIRLRPLRYTWQDVMYRPTQVLRDIEDTLGATLP